jgi:hypothetical protein
MKAVKSIVSIVVFLFGCFLFVAVGLYSLRSSQFIIDFLAKDTPYFYKIIGSYDEITLPKSLQKMKYAIEFTVFDEKDKAQDLIGKLSRQGLNAYLYEIKQKTKFLYRVQAGSYGIRSKAKQDSDYINKRKQYQTKVVDFYSEIGL